jgi:hypothetical protein
MIHFATNYPTIEQLIRAFSNDKENMYFSYRATVS